MKKLKISFTNKGLDSLTEKELRKKIEVFLVSEGYKDIRGKKENEVTYTRTEDKNEHSIGVTYSSNTVKKILNSAYYEKFTNRELRFFDSLGFKVQLYQSKVTGQIIEDWFAKGLDDVDPRESVTQKLKELGWKHNTATATVDVFVSTDDTVKLSNSLLKQIRIDWKFKSLTSYKFMNGSYVHTDAPIEILKFLDSLGFEYSDSQKSTGDYNIEDWFAKGLDQLTKPELIKIVTKKLAELDYVIHNKRDMLDWTDEQLNDIISVEYDHMTTHDKIEVSFKHMTVIKATKSYAVMKFTNEELKLFDSLGFKLSDNTIYWTKQEIEDWFKALDMIDVNNPLALSEAVESFYKALYPGDIYDFKMEKSSWRGSSGYEIYYKLQSENDEKINTKHRVMLLKYDNESKTFEISKDVETDKKGFFTTMNAERFTNKELEFFDKLGFTVNDAHDIEQEIEDWFK